MSEDASKCATGSCDSRRPTGSSRFQWYIMGAGIIVGALLILIVLLNVWRRRRSTAPENTYRTEQHRKAVKLVMQEMGSPPVQKGDL